MLEDDDRPARPHAAHLEVQGGRGALLDGPGVDLEGLGGRHPLVPLLDGVELDLEAGGQLAHHAAPGHGQHAGLQDHGDVVDGPAESHDVEDDHGLVVGGVVEDLGAPDLVDPLADPGQHQGQRVVGEPGVDAVDEQGDPAFQRRRRAPGRSSRRATTP